MCGEEKQTSCCCEGVCIVVKPSEKGCTIQVCCSDEAKVVTPKPKAEESGDSAGGDCCK